jgi:hypothetical protein
VPQADEAKPTSDKAAEAAGDKTLAAKGLGATPSSPRRSRPMKATIERATLLKSLGHVQSVVERRNTIPILSNVLIEAREDGSLRLMATDLDLQVDESVPPRSPRPARRPFRPTPSSTSSASCPKAARSSSPPPRARCRSSPAARASTCRPCRATISR